MADLALDTTTGDILITDDNFTIVDGDNAIVQQLTIRLQFFLAEWFLDERQGIDYFGSILVKNPDLIAVQAIFREAIIETPGVAGFDRFDLSVDSAIRNLTVNFTVRKTEGGELDFSQEFIIG